MEARALALAIEHMRRIVSEVEYRLGVLLLDG